MNDFKSRRGIRLPTICEDQNCGKETGFCGRAMFVQYNFALPVLHNILHHFFACKFYHFTCLTVLEGDMVWITNYDYNKYFSISEWENQVDHVTPKLKGGNNTTKENYIDE